MNNEAKPLSINIAKEFSDAPGARYKKDGPKSGEEFFIEILDIKFSESLNNKTKLIINFDGTYGYATSFLSECFGLLARKYGQQIVRNNLELVSQEDPLIIDFVNKTITESA